MIAFSSKYRSTQDEIMDDLQLQGSEMKSLLTDLKTVNQLLGGNAITINGINKLLLGLSKDQTYTVLDVGCGDGEMLRRCARFAKSKGYSFELIGVDANEYILEEAKRRSLDFQNISYKKIDVFSDELKDIKFDIALCTLFLHHFSSSEITQILKNLTANAKVGVVVNDLHRSRLAFWLFKLFSALFLKTNIAKHDGLVSVASGFKLKDLQELSEQIKNSESCINWKWAFRYQWILN